jgi:putative phosphoribosyl transferase
MSHECVIPARDTPIEATLTVPIAARSLVVVPRASAAGRFQSGARFLAETLEQSGLATLSVDLLTGAEEALPSPDVEALLSQRLASVIEWVTAQPATRDLALGLCCSARETAAALAIAEKSPRISALVSFGGEPESHVHLLLPRLVVEPGTSPGRAAEQASEFFSRQLLR